MDKLKKVSDHIGQALNLLVDERDDRFSEYLAAKDLGRYTEADALSEAIEALEAMMSSLEELDNKAEEVNRLLEDVEGGRE